MNKKFELWLFIFFTLALVLVRPTFLGQQYTLIGFFIASFIFIIKYISFDSDFYVVSKKSDVEILQLFTLFVFYSLSGLISALGNSNSFFVAQAAVSCCLITLYVVVINMFQFGEISIGRIFTYLNAAFGLSIIISFVLIQFIDPSVLTLFQLNIKGYNTDGSNETSGALIFPFSVSYGLLVEYNITRFLGIGRESGIGQMFLCWSFVYAYLNKMSKYVIWTCFFGGALCMATSGIVSLGVSFFILMNVRNNDAYSLLKKYVSFLIPFVMAFVLIFAPGIGLNNKQETHSASITDRTDAIFDAFNNEHIVFGTGLYSDHKYDNAAINLLAGVSEYGIVGLFLLLAIFVIPLFYKSINKMYYLALVAPLVITSMFFQPLFDAPLFYVVCILSTSCAYINPISSNKYT